MSTTVILANQESLTLASYRITLRNTVSRIYFSKESKCRGADINVTLKVNQLNPSGTSALCFTNLLSRLLDQVRSRLYPYT